MGYFKWTVTTAWHINCFWIAFSFLMDPTQVALPEERLCAESEDWLFTCFRKSYVYMSGDRKGFEKETLSPRQVIFVSCLSLVLSTSHSECLQFIFDIFLHSAHRSGYLHTDPSDSLYHHTITPWQWRHPARASTFCQQSFCSGKELPEGAPLELNMHPKGNALDNLINPEIHWDYAFSPKKQIKHQKS